jgi:hypothetical protein
MLAATSANFGSVGAAALIIAIRNWRSAASSQTILLPSDWPEGILASSYILIFCFLLFF